MRQREADYPHCSVPLVWEIDRNTSIKAGNWSKWVIMADLVSYPMDGDAPDLSAS